MAYRYWSKCKLCRKEIVSAKRVVCYKCVVTPLKAGKKEKLWYGKRRGWKIIREDATNVFFRTLLGQIRTVNKQYLINIGSYSSDEDI